uniref:Protein binding protein n=1 Tax=Rhizophora mucronata TaxID=61149 RepID=A0A2P2JT44_RHIMU
MVLIKQLLATSVTIAPSSSI